MPALIIPVLSYFLGSIPFGFIIANLIRKIDIRQFGSGNIGATNVWRVIGPSWGILVFILDFLKGFSPILIIKIILPASPNYVFVLGAISAVAGHNWPVFLKFKGGKGVATSIGAASGLCLVFGDLRLVLILSICIWLGVFFSFRIVSLASILGAFGFLIFSLIFSLPNEIKGLSFLLFLLILLRHKKNIEGLLTKKEHRF